MELFGRIHYKEGNYSMRRFQWPRGLRYASAAALLLGLRFRFPSGAWVSVSCESCVLSFRRLSLGLIYSPVRCVRNVVCLSVIVKSQI
jgi:hypothetical protein